MKNDNFGWLSNIFSLAYLDISYNNLGEFHLNGIFGRLEELHIEGNNLTMLDPNLRQTAPKLARIDLNDNNWNCDYLNLTLLHIPINGIELVRNSFSPLAERKYTGIVMGTPCFVSNSNSSESERIIQTELIPEQLPSGTGRGIDRVDP